MDKSTLRSDEQLAYYVAQAREVIDLSVMSQKEVVEELRQLTGKPAPLAGQVG
jgi:alpha-glucosidase (family GH31 glycosyl hydrolase)